MKKKLRYKILIVVLSFIFLIGCTTKKVEVKLKLKNGDMLQVEENTEKNYTNEIEEVTNVNSLKKNVLYSSLVKSIDERKNINMMVTIKELTVSYVMNNGDIFEYSSNLNTEQNNKIGKIFSYLMDKSFEVFISEQGKINDIVGLDEIINKSIENIEFSSQEEEEMYSKIIFEEFGRENTIMKLNNLNDVYKDEAVKEGESWDKKGEFKEIVFFDTKGEYKLESVSDKNGKIKENTKLKSNKEKSKLTIENFIYNFDLTGEENGEIYLDTETGIIKNADLMYKSEGIVKVTSENPDEGAKEYPLKITVKHSITINK
ncbi:hypothetical protein SH2C18_11630 [Clostridium sediminicola]|uniref:DUF6263 family protein n=1 Tax=Clostridium sediminicola TaxID=3114879 RepID=UPI0031F26ABC